MIKKGKRYSLFPVLCKNQFGITPTEEHQFHPVRKWRFDFAFIEQKLAVEVEGGIFTGGRHTRGKGFLNDIEKYNTATSLGWRILRVVPKDLYSGGFFNIIKQTLNDINTKNETHQQNR